MPLGATTTKQPPSLLGSGDNIGMYHHIQYHYPEIGNQCVFGNRLSEILMKITQTLVQKQTIYIK